MTDDEDLVFLQLSKGKSKVAVAENCGISTPTVDNRIKAINKKIVRLEMVQCE